MYKQIFIDYLNNFQFDETFSAPIEYIIKNNNANFIRPQLVLSFCDLYGGDIKKALPLALAVECIHTASLIYDDLPCMDNENFRRGKKCLHLEFNESTAILTATSLIFLAFNLIATSELSIAQKSQSTYILSTMAQEMCIGQQKELIGNSISSIEWIDIHRKKTGSLIACACALGAISAEKLNIEDALSFGYALGINYQIKDDIKDNDGISSFNDEKINKIVKSNKSIIQNDLFVKNKFLKKIGECVC